jgi:hypothetical protein
LFKNFATNPLGLFLFPLQFQFVRFLMLAAVKKRGKPADIDDGKRPSIMVNKKGAR